MPPSQPNPSQRERHGQIRGLFILAALVLLWSLFRADRRAIFHSGWWRL